MGKLTSTTTIPNHNRSIEESIDEVHRELCVRRRIYGRWVQEKKLSLQEARDRGERMEAALHYLMTHPNTEVGYEPKVEEKEYVAPPF